MMANGPELDRVRPGSTANMITSCINVRNTNGHLGFQVPLDGWLTQDADSETLMSSHGKTMNGWTQKVSGEQPPPCVSPSLRLRVTSCVSVCTYLSLESALDSASFFFSGSSCTRRYDLLADILMPVIFPLFCRAGISSNRVRERTCTEIRNVIEAVTREDREGGKVRSGVFVLNHGG